MTIVTSVQPAVALTTALAQQAPGAPLHTTVGTVSTSLAGAAPQAVTLVNPGSPGPAGTPGPPGNVAHYLAAGDVQGHKAVAVDATGRVGLADPTALAQLGAVVGVSTNAAAVDGDVTVRTGDVVEHPGWAWAPNSPVFVGLAGALVQAPPDGAAWLQVIGWAPSATRLLVAPQPPIQLNGVQ